MAPCSGDVRRVRDRETCRCTQLPCIPTATPTVPDIPTTPAYVPTVRPFVFCHVYLPRLFNSNSSKLKYAFCVAFVHPRVMFFLIRTISVKLSKFRQKFVKISSKFRQIFVKFSSNLLKIRLISLNKRFLTQIATTSKLVYLRYVQ